MILITVSVLKKAVYKRNLYSCIWELIRTITLLAVKSTIDEISDNLQGIQKNYNDTNSKIENSS
ncbi:hypothetical protein RhiirA4_475352 [Rhizophagus irregularis]|uniref:Uncharacterized protein n=1 Tax=Rhizophagus irregularis TaxID=588596 RepID=A0A2I1HA11_9GLOM|nr:hypothetical protein RhiirA4_475352 [Rhizophagus irregularis]